jgi:hypothetical protein
MVGLLMAMALLSAANAAAKPQQDPQQVKRV